MVIVTASYSLKTFSFERSKSLLDFCLADSIIFYFWYVLESIHKFITKVHVLQSLFVRRCNKKERRCRIISNFTKGEIFFFLWQPSALLGNLTIWIPFLDPRRNAFLFPLVCPKSIVCIRVSSLLHLQKTPPPLSWQAPT